MLVPFVPEGVTISTLQKVFLFHIAKIKIEKSCDALKKFYFEITNLLFLGGHTLITLAHKGT